MATPTDTFRQLSIEALLDGAIAHHQKGQLAAAEPLYREVLSRDRSNGDAIHLLGLLLSRTARVAEGLALLDEAVAADPSNAIIQVNRGAALRDAGRIEDAISSYRNAIEIDPDFPEAHFNLANTLVALSRPDEALVHYDRAIAARPDYLDALSNRGNALAQLRRFEEAAESFRTVAARRPKSADAHHNLAVAVSKLNRHQDALPSFDAALAIAPDHAAARKGRGNSLRQLGRLAEAVEEYSRELTILRSAETMSTVVAEAWRALIAANAIPLAYRTQDELEATRAAVEVSVSRMAEAVSERRQPTAGAAGKAMAFHLDGFAFAYHQKNDRALMRSFSSAISSLLGADRFEAPSRASASDRMRIGIAAERLRDHNGANWAYQWLARLPPGYEFFTYSFEHSNDPVATAFKALGTHRDLTFGPDSFEAAMEAMLGDRLDFLMLPEVGMTPASRVLSLYRLAPVQFTGWGHPVTSGSANMDYYLSSDLMEPVEAPTHYSEQLVRLPNLGLYLTPPTADRTQVADLPEDRVIYGCLQSLIKYVPRYDEILPRIARAIPKALFLFIDGKPAYLTDITRDRLVAAFARAGLDASRHLLFLPRVSHAQYVELQRRVDVLVDSVGWSGGNTSISAIEVGAPLVTLEGEFMRGRHTSAMLRLIGLDEAIASSLDDYVAKLIELGRRPELRREMQQRMLSGSDRLYGDSSVIAGLDGFFRRHLRR